MGTVHGLPPLRGSWGKCVSPRGVSVVGPVLLVLGFLVQLYAAFNLDTEKRVVFTGPPGSYFGYSVEFFGNSSSILIGAPKANTSQPDITEGGAVYSCPWSQPNCSIINFDKHGDRYFYINDVKTRVEFKSHQWFGATIRSHGNNILACAPRYYWRTEHDTPFADVTGTCYLSVDSLKSFVEYAPCRTERHGPAGQGYCQGGFSADFTKDGRVVLGGPGSFYWQGQVISATTEEIIKAYYPSYFLLSVVGQLQTRQVQGSYDDSYLGEEPPLSWIMLLAATDINNDGLDDVVVGAPLFMRRGSGGQLEELGKVYVYLQRGPLELDPAPSHLLGFQAFSRFGSSLAPLGDLNQDGFNDLAVGCPYGGDDQQGLVLIYNGHEEGLKDTPTQTLSGQWATTSFPASFGFTLRSNRDLDRNGYPDLMVGAFGVDKAVLYRARPIVSATASLTVQPTMFNQEEKSCTLSTRNQTTWLFSWCLVLLCVLCEGFVVEVQLDSVKQHQKESIRRTVFLETHQPSLVKSFNLTNGQRLCHDAKIYLLGEEEFRDKLSPIYISLNFSLDPEAPVDQHGLRPILNYQTEQLIQMMMCGFFSLSDKSVAYLGDENAFTLIFNAMNEGEGGAYEAELYVALPPDADYSGIARNNVSLTQLTCSYDAENQTRYLLCDLGNPMKSGTSLWAGLRFTVPRLKDTYKTVQFELQIRSKNANNSESEVVVYELEVAAMAEVILQGVSRPDKVIFPPPNWSMSQGLRDEQDVGPELQQVYELVNNGPSVISQSTVEVRCPLRAHGLELLYPVEVVTKGPLSCSSKHTFNALKLQVNPHTHTHKHTVHNSAGILSVPGGADVPTGVFAVVQVSAAVIWGKPDGLFLVPVWIIILAVLAGLLLLALLIYLLYKMGFFKRSDPYGTTMEKAHLKPQASSEA
uniref:Integrin subunit alpha 5 n=1 Tax=Sphaeramia orbicularis TaxID=375764 RepID=A0A672ZE57_9TELE